MNAASIQATRRRRAAGSSVFIRAAIHTATVATSAQPPTIGWNAVAIPQHRKATGNLRQQRHRRVAEPDREQRPAGDPAEPRRLIEWQRRGDRSRHQVEDAVRVGRLQKKITTPPRGIGGMPRLREIHRFVHVGCGPGAGRGERGGDEQAFEEGTGPTRLSIAAAFTRHAMHL